MEALGWWLMLMGSLRLASLWFRCPEIRALRRNDHVSKSTLSEVLARTFGFWTLLTSTLCYLCAFNLENRPLYLATFLSFIYSFGHFLAEVLYETMDIADLTNVGYFAGTSIIWMLLLWNQRNPVYIEDSGNMIAQ